MGQHLCIMTRKQDNQTFNPYTGKMNKKRQNKTIKCKVTQLGIILNIPCVEHNEILNLIGDNCFDDHTCFPSLADLHRAVCHNKHKLLLARYSNVPIINNDPLWNKPLTSALLKRLYNRRMQINTETLQEVCSIQTLCILRDFWVHHRLSQTTQQLR